MVDGLPYEINGQRITYVYQIEIDPASPSYNEVVNTFHLGMSDGARRTPPSS